MQSNSFLEDTGHSLEGYRGWWTRLAGHLGAVYPFYDLASPDYFSLEIADVIAKRVSRSAPVELDRTAVACKVGLPYLLGNRTLVKGVERAPWVERPVSPGEWQLMPLPDHGSAHPDKDEFLEKFIQALRSELEGYVGNSRTVGILLSGGMDSRVVAGVLREVELQNPGRFDVVALSWGAAGSRDVVYAERIARQFGWSFEHFPITAETLRENIDIAGYAGAEVSPLHLHAMPAIARLKNIDLVLAGSYGDSVGRAEFSGVRVANLKPILPSNIDPFGVLKHSAKKAAEPELARDVRCSGHFRSDNSSLRNFEIEQEMHYMRRMLQSCMLHIGREIPLYQMFTAPAVFGLMWQLAPEERGDHWYQYVLEALPGRLLDIPWARTGSRYLEQSGEADRLPKAYHAYGEWLRNDLQDLVVSRVNSDAIRGLGLFNDKGLDKALRNWLKAETKGSNSLDELISWLASLYTFLEAYPVSCQPAEPNVVGDAFSAMRGSLYGNLYVRARNYFRE
ncbi:asparagine synthase-related protein [Marinobacter sp. W-8]|uniref:asparagine synthase-related protein n=1 Tax=Marinobacter sp. W-8 TaxID=3369658 RepID=UPI0037C8A432